MLWIDDPVCYWTDVLNTLAIWSDAGIAAWDCSLGLIMRYAMDGVLSSVSYAEICWCCDVDSWIDDPVSLLLPCVLSEENDYGEDCC